MTLSNYEKSPPPIDLISEEKIPEIARLHLLAFEGYTNTKLGAGYVEDFLRFFSADNRRIAIFASLANDVPCGYVVGAPLGYGTAMNKFLWRRVALAVALRPWVWLDSQFQSVLWGRLFPPKSSRKKADQDQPVLYPPTVSLVGIAVHPKYQGMRIGERLMKAFEEAAICRGFRSMRLSVYPDNNAACRLYHRSGWAEFSGGQDSKNGGAIIYYKNLSDSGVY